MGASKPPGTSWAKSVIYGLLAHPSAGRGFGRKQKWLEGRKKGSEGLRVQGLGCLDPESLIAPDGFLPLAANRGAFGDQDFLDEVFADSLLEFVGDLAAERFQARL